MYGLLTNLGKAIVHKYVNNVVNLSNFLMYIGSNRPAMKYLNRHVVANIAACWQEVGYELLETEREDEIQLNTIKSEPGLNNKERAIKMLTLWRDKNPCASWNDLIKALRVPSIGLFTTAVDIEAKLLPEG